jgi:hypothetical protein
MLLGFLDTKFICAICGHLLEIIVKLRWNATVRGPARLSEVYQSSVR